MASSAETAQSLSSDSGSYGPLLEPRSNAPTSAQPRAPDGSLASLVAGEIIPRLMMAHGCRPDACCADAAGPTVAAEEIAAFAPLALKSDAQGLLARVEHLLARGVEVDAIMVEVLAPAARTLGTWWEEDRCDFVEVTMGLWRLQEVVRELSLRVAPPSHFGTAGTPRRALFATFPGEQHDFGTVMVGELFHRHGWDVETEIGIDMSTLLADVGRHHYDIVGLTVSCDCHSARLPSAILAVRSVSRNPRVRVMVGGRVLNADPSLAARAGADATASDARTALMMAEGLVDALVRDAVACG